MSILDEYTREYLAILVKQHITSQDVIDQLSPCFSLEVCQLIPGQIADLITSKAVCGWLTRLGVKTLFIEPGSPWENGYIESLNGKLRDERLNREVFDALVEAKILIESLRKDYNDTRPHSTLGYRPPAPEATMVAILT